MSASYVGFVAFFVLAVGTGSAFAREKSLPDRVQIASNVWMPKLTLNAYPNTISWLRLGGRSMDTALDYGDARQREMGQAVRASNVSRKDIFVITKVPCCPKQPFGKAGWPFLPAPNCTRARNTTADIDYDLRTIGVEYVDLMLLHFTCDRFEDTERAWRALEAAHSQKKARAIGVSNFNLSDIDNLMKVARIPPAVNQAGFAIGSPQNKTLGRDWETIKRCKELGITYQAYAPFGERNATAPTSRVNVLTDPTVRRIAERHNVSNALVGLRWVLQHGLAVVTSSHNPNYQAEDLRVFTALNLSASDMAQLDAIP